MNKESPHARPRLRTVTLDEVKITRDDDYAIFDYKDPSMGGGMRIVFVREDERHKTPKIKASTGKRERSDG